MSYFYDLGKDNLPKKCKECVRKFLSSQTYEELRKILWKILESVKNVAPEFEGDQMEPKVVNNKVVNFRCG